MPQTFVKVRGIDSLLFRDGRPFDATGGLTASSLPLPLPPTLAAFVRSQIGGHERWDWTDVERLKLAHTIPVHGPLLMRGGKLWLPAPRDAVILRADSRAGGADEGACTGKRPLGPATRISPRELPAGCGTDLPEGLRPLQFVDGPPENAGKPDGGGFFPADDMLRWLAEEPVEAMAEEVRGLPDEHERIGIQLDRDKHAAAEGMLYAVRMRAFEERVCKDGGAESVEYSLVARASMPDGLGYGRVGSLGGERRLTIVEPLADSADIWPRCPATLKAQLAGAARVRMVLATPAHFKRGWKPGWIEQSGSGAQHLPAGIAKVRLRLVGAAVARRIPISGWRLSDLEAEAGGSDGGDTVWTGSARGAGPRRIRWLAPAGSVYFFEVDGGDAAVLGTDAWMQPMSDIEQDRCDGLGLALWGIW